jgi:GDPmannose 4,6-dehydratase
VQADFHDQSSMVAALTQCKPDEIDNLAAQSFAAPSRSQAVSTGEGTALSLTCISEAIRSVNPKVLFYQASSCEMFGIVTETPQKETPSLYPCRPNGVAKVYGHWITANYRETYSLYSVSGILFNHRSPRRGLEFVTHRIAHRVARIKRVEQRTPPG